jgi:hypothetical protein
LLLVGTYFANEFKINTYRPNNTHFTQQPNIITTTTTTYLTPFGAEIECGLQFAEIGFSDLKHVLIRHVVDLCQRRHSIRHHLAKKIRFTQNINNSRF